jgi:hypothetical protein
LLGGAIVVGVGSALGIDPTPDETDNLVDASRDFIRQPGGSATLAVFAAGVARYFGASAATENVVGIAVSDDFVPVAGVALEVYQAFSGIKSGYNWFRDRLNEGACSPQ